MKFNGIEFTSDRLINLAMENLDRSQGDVPFDHSTRLTQQSIAYSLIAIGQELKRANDLELKKLAPPDSMISGDKDLGW